MRATRPSSAFVTAVVVAFASPASAEPGSRVRCSDSYERAQVLRRSDDFAGARAALDVCTSTCPADLVADCEKWKAELGVLMPTVKLIARDEHGAMLDHFVVSEEGKSIVPNADGLVSVAPGRHLFRFERPGNSPADVVVDIQPGEREHPVSVTMMTEARAAPPPAPAPARSETKSSAVPAIALLALGGAGLVVAGSLTLKGHLDRSDLKSNCFPACDPAKVDDVRTLFWTAGGVAALSVGALVGAFFLRPRTLSRRTTVSASTSGAGFRVSFD
jgi:hypothetical protein